ncbi:hypothetical protein [Paraburkholderia pallida]|uniref:Phage tail protein (Tail_P2_I) n=1 Tax=Paraburkholderia pallida TaxID=2547399 RepID=A0A4P7D0V1_9BURK|nr:hypothetical protein [Paraburkholderia pallida]QBR01438.1 hypothetical protein E1956_30065 [Paraburkholderia pallida]
MNPLDVDSIYGLLPVTVRTSDAAAGCTLRALIEVLTQQAQYLDADLEQLYDNLFIQTCAPWVIPYIGELIGYRALRPIPPANATARADVADTIGYRRRKGTVAVLDQLGFDVTGWPSVAVEFFQLLAVSQYVRNHVRPGNACVDVHGFQSAADFDSAFDTMTRSADVRRIASARGRYNIPNVGIFVWRLLAYGGAMLAVGGSTTGTAGFAGASGVLGAEAFSTAREVGPNRYTFDPFGRDVALVNPPQPLAQSFTITQRANVPYALRRDALYVDLEALRTTPGYQSQFFGVPPVLAVLDTNGTAVDAKAICCCDLAEWSAPTDPAIRVSVDPELGRLMFNGPPPQPVRVAYAYVFGGPYGGGLYYQAPDTGEGTAQVVSAFASAVAASMPHGVFEIGDSGAFAGDFELTPDATPLVVRAGVDTRPVVLGRILIDAVAGGSVTLRGLGALGGIVVRDAPGSGASSSSSASTSSMSSASSASSGALAATDSAFTLNVEHCTLCGPLVWSYDGGGTLTIANALCAALHVDERVTISVTDSAVDGGADTAPAIAGADGTSPCGEVDLAATTVLGTIAARETSLIENSIVTGVATFERTQGGCVRYSYVPPGSLTPQRFRCQPDLAIAAALAAASAAAPLDSATEQAITAQEALRVEPVFVSRQAGAGGYLQLADSGPAELAQGAESGDEMGLFHGMYNVRREANLRFRLTEYLRIGLEAGVIHAS